MITVVVRVFSGTLAVASPVTIGAFWACTGTAKSSSAASRPRAATKARRNRFRDLAAMSVGGESMVRLQELL